MDKRCRIQRALKDVGRFAHNRYRISITAYPQSFLPASGLMWQTYNTSKLTLPSAKDRSH
jgi:hypothetical protein